MTQAYSYVRWSSEKQSLGDSDRRQFEAALAYAAKHNLTLSTTRYTDAGISAFKGLNAAEGALKAFLDAVDAGTVSKGSVLLVESLDRLSRLPVNDALRLFQDIVGRGIEIVTLNDNQRYSLDRINENWTSLIIALAVMSRANEESKTKSKRVKEAWDNKRANGEILTAMSPPWLRLSEDRKSWGVVQEQATKVQRIFKEALGGAGAPTIARRLNEEGIKPFQAEYWTNGTVAHVLQNRSVIGTYTPSKVALPPVENYYPAIIDEATFWEVQAGVKARKWKGGTKSDDVSNLFTGLCFCGVCGDRMKFVSSSKPNLYLRCNTSYSGGSCTAPRMPYHAAEKELLMWLVEGQFAFPRPASTEKSERVVIEGALAEKQTRLNNLMDLVEGGVRTAADRVVKLEAEIEELQRKLRVVIEPSPLKAVFDAAFDFAEELNTAEGDKKNELRRSLRSIFQQVVQKLSFDGIEDGAGKVRVLLHPGINIQIDVSPEVDEVTRTADGFEATVWYPLPRQGFQPGNRNGKR